MESGDKWKLGVRSEVELDGVMGCDEDIARIARVSTGSKRKGWRADLELISRLVRDEHESPLEMGVMRFKIRLPLMIAAQLLRHRMASYSQVSGRFVELDLSFYEPEEWHGQSEGNRQTSGEALGAEVQGKAHAAYEKAIVGAATAYLELLELGVSREEARIVLPQCLHTTIYVQMNLRSLMNLLTLRMAHDAQTEFQVIARQMFEYADAHFPQVMFLMGARNEYRRQVRDGYMAFMKKMVAALGDENGDY